MSRYMTQEQLIHKYIDGDYKVKEIIDYFVPNIQQMVDEWVEEGEERKRQEDAETARLNELTQQERLSYLLKIIQGVSPELLHSSDTETGLLKHKDEETQSFIVQDMSAGEICKGRMIWESTTRSEIVEGGLIID